jgi:UDP-N-acetylglucosamine 2-epimerase (non-hydrolysing)/GDP/UDP-N,N'-diacetylbacillosamine 2-epimerase (hydrolysing)
MKKRLIAVFTGNRAEYGLQYPVLKAIDEHPELEYRLIVSGAHLDDNFGNTLEEIKNDGFRIDYEVKIEIGIDSKVSTSRAIGSGVLSISEALKEINPDIMVVYADRFEGFAAVISATQMNIPTAHIEGGDLTEGGALDDSVRHAMSKLSHIHFTTNQQATNRILAMGEESWRIHTVGFPAIDLILEDNYASFDEVSTSLSIDLSLPVILFTQHSITTEFQNAEEQLMPSLIALKNLAKQGVQVILTYPNNDVGGQKIINKLNELKLESLKNIQVHKSLGRYLYHGVLALASNSSFKVACVGNSSSGIKETPAFLCPTVNIGSRQKGRLRAENIIDTGYDQTEIFNAVTKCFNSKEFRSQCSHLNNPYYLGGAGKKMADVLASVKLNSALIRKKMTLKGNLKNGWYQ